MTLPFLNLPPELRLKILQYCPSWFLYRTMRLVCKPLKEDSEAQLKTILKYIYDALLVIEKSLDASWKKLKKFEAAIENDPFAAYVLFRHEIFWKTLFNTPQGASILRKIVNHAHISSEEAMIFMQSQKVLEKLLSYLHGITFLAILASETSPQTAEAFLKSGKLVKRLSDYSFGKSYLTEMRRIAAAPQSVSTIQMTRPS